MKRLGVLFAALAVTLAVSASAVADQSYTDPGGDAGVGTDIVGTTVRNDISAGTITIQVASANPIVANHAVAIFIDADRNSSTGDQGDDYWMYGGPATGIAFFAWNGSAFAETNPATFGVGAAASNVTEFRFNKADIGNVSGFNFAVVSISIDGDNLKFWDAAPDTGYFSYDLAVAPPPPPPPPPPPAVIKPVIAAPTTTGAPLAGKKFSVVFSITRSDDGSSLTNGVATCVATIANKALACAESFKGGTARLSFHIPKTAKGKALKIKLTIKAGSQSASRTVTFHIK